MASVQLSLENQVEGGEQSSKMGQQLLHEQEADGVLPLPPPMDSISFEEEKNWVSNAVNQLREIANSTNSGSSSSNDVVVNDSAERWTALLKYALTRRHAWSDATTVGTEGVKAADPQDVENQRQLNDLLDQLLLLLKILPLSVASLSAHASVVMSAANPVVRDRAVGFFFHRLKWQFVEHGVGGAAEEGGMLDTAHFNEIKRTVLLGLMDVWSAIRNATAKQLFLLAESFDMRHMESLFADLFAVLKESNWEKWREMEGALQGLTVLLKRFVSEDCVDASSARLRCGSTVMNSLPSFITDVARIKLFFVIAHPQVSVRDHATRFFAAYLARSPLEETLSCLGEVTFKLSECSTPAPSRKSDLSSLWDMPPPPSSSSSASSSPATASNNSSNNNNNAASSSSSSLHLVHHHHKPAANNGSPPIARGDSLSPFFGTCLNEAPEEEGGVGGGENLCAKLEKVSLEGKDGEAIEIVLQNGTVSAPSRRDGEEKEERAVVCTTNSNNNDVNNNNNNNNNDNNSNGNMSGKTSRLALAAMEAAKRTLDDPKSGPSPLVTDTPPLPQHAPLVSSGSSPSLGGGGDRRQFATLEAYEAEGLIAFAQIIMRLAPSENWKRIFCTFDVYLGHEASTVRQACSTLFQVIMAKEDASEPVLQRLLLHSIATPWRCHGSSRGSRLPRFLMRSSSAERLTVTPNNGRRAPISRQNSMPAASFVSLAGPSAAVAAEQTLLRTLFGSNLRHDDALDAIQTWEWKEGRLLTYELLLNHLASEYLRHLFPTSSPVRSLALATPSPAPRLKSSIASPNTPASDKGTSPLNGSRCSTGSGFGDHANSLVEQLKEMEDRERMLDDDKRDREPLRVVLARLVIQVLFCAADERWELRRMALQVVSPLAQVMFWFDFSLLEELWHSWLPAAVSSRDPPRPYVALLTLKIALKKMVEVQEYFQSCPPHLDTHNRLRLLGVVGHVQNATSTVLPYIDNLLNPRTPLKIAAEAAEIVVFVHTRVFKDMENEQQRRQVRLLLDWLCHLRCLARGGGEQLAPGDEMGRSTTPDHKTRAGGGGARLATNVERSLIAAICRHLPEFMSTLDFAQMIAFAPLLSSYLTSFEDVDVQMALIECLQRLVRLPLLHWTVSQDGSISTLPPENSVSGANATSSADVTATPQRDSSRHASLSCGVIRDRYLNDLGGVSLASCFAFDPAFSASGRTPGKSFHARMRYVRPQPLAPGVGDAAVETAGNEANKEAKNNNNNGTSDETNNDNKSDNALRICTTSTVSAHVMASLSEVLSALLHLIQQQSVETLLLRAVFGVLVSLTYLLSDEHILRAILVSLNFRLKPDALRKKNELGEAAVAALLQRWGGGEEDPFLDEGRGGNGGGEEEEDEEEEHAHHIARPRRLLPDTIPLPNNNNNNNNNSSNSNNVSINSSLNMSHGSAERLVAQASTVSPPASMSSSGLVIDTKVAQDKEGGDGEDEQEEGEEEDGAGSQASDEEEEEDDDWDCWDEEDEDMDAVQGEVGEVLAALFAAFAHSQRDARVARIRSFWGMPQKSSAVGLSKLVTSLPDPIRPLASTVWREESARLAQTLHDDE